MRIRQCWVIDNYGYRPCPKPATEFRSLVSLHTHSQRSEENLGALNRVVRLFYMRPFRRLLQRSFGLAGVPALDYGDIRYHPPWKPEDILRVESEAVRPLGFDHVSLAITDHDEIRGGLELLHARRDQGPRLGLGEELSFRFRQHLFHLGITGLAEENLAAVHAGLQQAARAEKLDELFERLRAAGCLVVLNHPLLVWHSETELDPPVIELLGRYGGFIHALEYNGMRRRRENDRVLELARRFSKPVVGGGDSHLLVPASVLCASSEAAFAGFIEEVRSGRAVPLVKPDYFAPLRWKLFLRVLSFIAEYRQIASFRGEPVRQLLDGRRVLLDPVGRAARLFLRLTATFGGLR